MFQWLKTSVDWINAKVDKVDAWTFSQVDRAEDFIKGHSLYPGKLQDRTPEVRHVDRPATAKYDEGSSQDR